MTGVSARSTTAVPPPLFLPGAEVALTGLTLATVFGFWRVFDRPSFLPPMLSVALVSHLGMVVGRRRGWAVPVTALVSAPAAALACVWLVFPSTTIAGVPSGRTVEAVSAALSESWHQFSNILAPAPPSAGFIVASSVALYVAVLLADWAAFRLWSSFEAAVPATTLFVFCTLLGAEHRLESAAAYVGALLLFLLLHRAARQESSALWLMSDAGRVGGPTPTSGRRSGPVVVGSTLVAVAVLTGSLVGPHLPGAGAPPVMPWRSSPQGPGERKAVSPLVRIRDRLLDQPDIPLFSVHATRPAYWRLTSLETFDGEIWRSQARYSVADGELAGDAPDGGGDELIEQTFTIENLNMIWAPAAYRPVRVVDHEVGLNFNDDSSTLIVEPNGSLEGSRYTIQSQPTQASTQALQTVTSADIPREIRERYLELPDGFSELARQTAKEQTQGRTRLFDMAKALQDFFRSSGRFTYDTAFNLGHGEDAIDAFLTERRGFCEQFAGTYAAMARSIGLPSRVAVGFTQGVVRDPTSPNDYEISGRQTHAWPEVYLGRFGWVMFEPTPERGSPNATWTGVPQEQDTGPNVPVRPVPPTATTPGTPAPLPVNPAPSTTERATTTTSAAPDDPATAPERSMFVQFAVIIVPILAGLSVLLLGLLALAAAYLVLLAWLRRRTHRERRAGATDASRHVLVAWQECLDALAVLRLVPQTTESTDEFTRRIAGRLGDAGPDLVALGEAVDHADYASDVVDDTVARNASRAAAVIIETVERLATPGQRWWHRIDPRPVADARRRGGRRPAHDLHVTRSM